jgi:hypothetical protein
MYIFLIFRFEILNNVLQTLCLSCISLPYSLSNFVKISAVSISIHIWKLQSLKKGAKYMSNSGGGRKGVFFVYDARLVPNLRVICKQNLAVSLDYAFKVAEL